MISYFLETLERMEDSPHFNWFAGSYFHHQCECGLKKGVGDISESFEVFAAFQVVMFVQNMICFVPLRWPKERVYRSGAISPGF